MQKIISCMLILILGLSTILIGIPQGDNTHIINILIAITAILSIIENRKEKHISLNITDVFLILIAISSVIPIIFKNYVSLNNTTEYALRYISILLIYFTIRKQTSKNSKISNYIVNAIIISAVFLIICGIDQMTTKKLQYLSNLIVGKVNIFTYEIRMKSLFMYPNAFAVYLSIALFLVFDKIKNNNNEKLNIAYKVLIMWFFIGIISSESRLVLACLAIVMIIYLIIDKNNIYNNLKNIITNGILAIIFTTLYFKLISLGMNEAIWISVIIFSLISAIINYLLQKLPNKKIHINIKIIPIAIIAIIVAIIILLNIKSDLVMFKGAEAPTIIRKQVCRTLGDRECLIKLDIEAKTNIEDNFTITLLEKDKSLKDIKETSSTLGNFNGIKEINVTLQEDTAEIAIYFKSKENNENTELRVKSLYVNGKEIILNYKFLPTALVNKVKNSSLANNNIVERVNFIKSAVIGAINNNFIGIGGGGWKYIHSKYQDYSSQITEVHSYPRSNNSRIRGLRNNCIYRNNYIMHNK